MVLLQVMLGLPAFLFPGGVQYNAVFQVFSFGILST
jgi:hypothetical protein